MLCLRCRCQANCHLSARQPLHLNLTRTARPPPSLTPITQHRLPQKLAHFSQGTKTPERRTDRARPAAPNSRPQQARRPLEARHIVVTALLGIQTRGCAAQTAVAAHACSCFLTMRTAVSYACGCMCATRSGGPSITCRRLRVCSSSCEARCSDERAPAHKHPGHARVPNPNQLASTRHTRTNVRTRETRGVRRECARCRELACTRAEG